MDEDRSPSRRSVYWIAAVSTIVTAALALGGALAGVFGGDEEGSRVAETTAPRTSSTPTTTQPPDADGDGVADSSDDCPNEAGDRPSGCTDRDGDGVADESDSCPDEAGDPPGGCPPEPETYDVPLAELCTVDGVEQDGGQIGRCPLEARTTKASGRVFTYVLEVGAHAQPRAAFKFPRTTCRRLKISFAYRYPDDMPAGNTLRVTLVQEATDPMSATAAPGELGTLTGELDGGAWQLEFDSLDDPVGAYNVAVNGSATCSSSTGV